MKRVTLTVPRNGQIVIPAELVTLARFEKATPLTCGWSTDRIVLAPASHLDTLGCFQATAACPMKGDGTLHLPYHAGRVLRVGTGESVTLQIKV